MLVFLSLELALLLSVLVVIGDAGIVAVLHAVIDASAVAADVDGIALFLLLLQLFSQAVLLLLLPLFFDVRAIIVVLSLQLVAAVGGCNASCCLACLVCMGGITCGIIVILLSYFAF